MSAESLEVKIKILTEIPEEFSLKIDQNEEEDLKALFGEMEQSWEIENLEDLIEFSPEPFNLDHYANFTDDSEPGPSNWTLEKPYSDFKSEEDMEKPEVDYSDLTEEELSQKFAEYEAEHCKMRIHPCMICKIAFSKNCKLQSHKKMHIKDLELKKERKMPNLKFKCPTCLGCFHSFKGLQHHMILHNPPRNYQCPSCEFSTKNRVTLSKHQKEHRIAAPGTYHCPATLCDFSTNNKTKLQKHLKEHSPKKIFKRQKK